MRMLYSQPKLAVPHSSRVTNLKISISKQISAKDVHVKEIRNVCIIFDL